METIKREMTNAAKFFLGLSLLSVLIDMFSIGTQISIAPSANASSTSLYLYIRFLIDFLLLITGISVFMMKKAGLIAFICLFVIRLFIFPFGTDVSTAYYIGSNFPKFVVDFAPFAIALCFKKNGISGWRAFLASDKLISNTINDNLTLEPAIHLDSTPTEKDNEEEDSSTYSQSLDNPIDEKSESININKSDSFRLPGKKAKSKKGLSVPSFFEKLRIRKSLKWKWIVPCSIIAVLGGLFLVINFKSYPEHINGFKNKLLFYFDLPNNNLAQELFNSYNKTKEAGFEDRSLVYLNSASLVKPTDATIIDSLLTSLYLVGANNKDLRKEYFDKTITLARRGIEKNPEDLIARRILIAALDNLNQDELAYKEAEDLLMQDSTDPLGIYYMCRRYLSSNNWTNLEKWGEKGYETVSDSSYWKPTIMYYYAKGLYENRKTKKAREVFFEASRENYDKDLSQKFAKVGGTPCKVLSLGVKNTKYDGTVITESGKTLYSQDTYYLSPVFKSIDYRWENFQFGVKIYRNGELIKCQEEAYSQGFSLVDDTAIFGKFDGNYYYDRDLDEAPTNEHELSGWGSDSSGWWKSGDYRIELWWEGEKLATSLFTIKDRQSYYW